MPRTILSKLDHCAIYLLIAGTYTPFALVSLRGTWGWWLLGIVWSLALFGIVQELWLGKRTRVLSLILYVLMGWLALVAVVPLMACAHALRALPGCWPVVRYTPADWSSMRPTTSCGMATACGTCSW